MFLKTLISVVSSVELYGYNYKSSKQVIIGSIFISNKANYKGSAEEEKIFSKLSSSEYLILNENVCVNKNVKLLILWSPG